jgi:hypothetical protein
MNNTFFSALLCIIVLAAAPACCKKSCKVTPKEDVRTTIELDNTVFEIEEDNTDQTAVKF